MSLIHASCVALAGKGVLLRGPSGVGKSDLALRLIHEADAQLVADDQCRLTREGPAVWVTAPGTIRDRIEARGVGILNLPAKAAVPLRLIVDLGQDLPRLPDPAREALLGVSIPRAALDAHESGAVAKLCLALAASCSDLERRFTDEGGTMTESGNAAGAPVRAGPPLKVVVVTGMSGAGRATTLKTLEDLGYESIDNLPLHVLPSIVHDGGLEGPIALGVDIRTRNFSAEPFLAALAELRRNPNLAITLLFLDCEDEVLRRRFTETRRRHPLAQERPITDGIAMERRLVAPLLYEADITLDTSSLAVADLREIVTRQLAPNAAPGMVVFVTSFSYKMGIPREADLVFDMRFLRNPHYDPAFRSRTGLEPPVAAYIEADPDYDAIMADLTGMLARLLPRYAKEGKSYLTVAVGCTGGRHRSVAVAEALAAFLRNEARRVVVNHRELGRRDQTEDAPADRAR